PHERWQFSEAPDTKGRPCLRGWCIPDEDRLCSELGCPRDGARVVINHQCVCRCDPDIGEDTFVVLRSLFEDIDQIWTIKTTKAIAHAHAVEVASQVDGG